MAGAFTSYFEAKRAAHQETADKAAAEAVAAANAANAPILAKVKAANAALNILAQTSISQADAERLYQLQAEAE